MLPVENECLLLFKLNTRCLVISHSGQNMDANE